MLMLEKENLVFFIENKDYYQKDLAFNLELSPDDNNFFEIAKELKELQILKDKGYDSQKNNNSLSLISKGDDNHKYCFTFVGLIFLNKINKLVFCLPKFIKNEDDQKYDENLKKAKLILNSIKKNNKISSNFSYIDFNNLINNKLSTSLTILIDYLENGLWESNNFCTELNKSGEINWDRTIATQQAYIINNVPYYLDYLTITKRTDDYDYIRQLHKLIITECSCYLKEKGFYLFFDELPLIEFNDINKNSLGSDNYKIYKLNMEINSTFEDKKLHTLKLLKAYIMNEGATSRNDIQLFGTSSYHVIFENMLQYTLRNQTDDLKNIIDKPVWHINYKNISFETEKDTLNPDVIINDEDFNILDAKYYNLFINQQNLDIDGQPGINSIIKQFLYKKAFEVKEAFKNKLFYNSFVFPYEMDEKIKYIGYITLKSMENEKINLFFIDPCFLITNYLNSNLIDLVNFKSLDYK